MIVFGKNDVERKRRLQVGAKISRAVDEYDVTVGIRLGQQLRPLPVLHAESRVPRWGSHQCPRGHEPWISLAPWSVRKHATSNRKQVVLVRRRTLFAKDIPYDFVFCFLCVFRNDTSSLDTAHDFVWCQNDYVFTRYVVLLYYQYYRTETYDRRVERPSLTIKTGKCDETALGKPGPKVPETTLRSMRSP